MKRSLFEHINWRAQYIAAFTLLWLILMPTLLVIYAVCRLTLLFPPRQRRVRRA
jgi:hypothetical protein